ncbi:Uncharacterised protein [Mycobacteroides abscessus subsp. abscessus]|nr:Uncharacterised protein [Mycobacteroides abscessus subsp. abscessus]
MPSSDVAKYCSVVTADASKNSGLCLITVASSEPIVPCSRLGGSVNDVADQKTSSL